MARVTTSIQEQIEQAAYPWGRPSDLDPLIERVGQAHYVLLGEASHGTQDFYGWRGLISQRLIEEKGFSFIAVEGDWPDCYRVNQYVKNYPNADANAESALRAFSRWPTWMWANREMIPIIEWLRWYNDEHDLPKPVGFYGLDVYSLWDSLHTVVEYLEKVDPPAAEQAKQAYRCFEPFGEDAQRYAYGTAFVPTSCEEDVLRVLQLLQSRGPSPDGEESFNAEQNARVVANAEKYYRTMLRGDAESWNIRDRHMVETLNHLAQRYGPDSKAIIWAHNTHVGDARYTDMAAGGMVNIGQLVREERGEHDVVLVGFSSHQGTVVAGKYWDAPMEIMDVPPAKSDSWEDAMHKAEATDKLILADDTSDLGEFWLPREHRAIGVVYNPERERLGNYVPTLLPKRYDALIHIDKSNALRPLHLEPSLDRDFPETFPWSV